MTRTAPSTTPNQLDGPVSQTVAVGRSADLLFGASARAARRAGVQLRDDVAVEAEVLAALYGDPSIRRRAHATRKR